jgi:hypothetical protein
MKRSGIRLSKVGSKRQICGYTAAKLAYQLYEITKALGWAEQKRAEGDRKREEAYASSVMEYTLPNARVLLDVLSTVCEEVDPEGCERLRERLDMIKELTAKGQYSDASADADFSLFILPHVLRKR